MSGNVVYLRAPSPIARYLRVGTSGHRQLETLQSAGRLHVDRIVVDAAMVTRQRDLLLALAEAGAELILDTNVAELASVGSYSGAAKAAPWANPQAALTSADLNPSANRDLIGQIARFAVQAGFNAVLAPTRVLQDSADPKLKEDIAAAAALRVALDRHGGKHVDIDYSLAIPSAMLRDRAQIRAFARELSAVSFDNLWVRVSGFGSGASPASLSRYITSLIDFHILGRPIVADGVGGLVGLSTAAFGAAGGICHGAAEKERFDASDWNKPAANRGRGGERRVLVEGLDKLLSAKQVDAFMASPGARRHFSCGDPSCCPRGLDDTLKDPKGHYLHQRHKQFEELSKVPEGRRSGHFLTKQLLPVREQAQQAAALEGFDEKLSKMLVANAKRVQRMHSVLKHLNTAITGEDISLPPIRRQNMQPTRALRGV